MKGKYIVVACILLAFSHLGCLKTIADDENRIATFGHDGAGNSTTNSTNNETDTNNLLKMVYWEVKPFIFTNKNGEIDGIFPKMFEQASVLCNNRKKFVKFFTKLDSRKSFYDLARSNLSYGEGILKGVGERKAFWAPILSPTNANNDEFLQRRHLKSFQLMESKGMSMIVRRDLISLPNKIIRGILACEQIFVLAILLAILFGVLLWTIERFRNDDFPDTFTNGVGIGLYWSIVSMTTVGYGDIQPKTPIGRLIACFWLFVGVTIGCIMTATLTDVVNGNDFTVRDKRVSVLEKSFEEQVAATQYQANVLPVQSYEQVIHMVRTGEVFAGLINSDVAHWYNSIISNDDEDVPLRIVETLPANLYVHCLMPTELVEEVRNIFRCMYYQKDEVYTLPKQSFHLYHNPETLYIGSTAELMGKNLYVRALIGVLGAILGVGIFYDVFKYIRNRKPKLNSPSTNEMEKLC